MNKQTFKVGDLVYFPQVSNKIFKLEDPGISEYYPLIIANDPHPMCFTSEGKMSFEHERQTIFHATEENCELLSKLYGIEFEKPKLSGKDIIHKMLCNSITPVVCKIPTEDGEAIDIIEEFFDEYFCGQFGKYHIDDNIQLYPIEQSTGKPIIDYIDGEAITEIEE